MASQRAAGRLVAGTLFVLPGVVALLALSSLYVGFGDTVAVEAVFAGLAPAVVAIVVQALVRISKRALATFGLVAIAVVAFVALSVLAVPFPVVILGAAAVGWALGQRTAGSPRGRSDTSARGQPEPLVGDSELHTERPTIGRVGVILRSASPCDSRRLPWPRYCLGGDSVLVDQGVFFCGTALVTFGGAYAVLSYVSHQALAVFGWVTPAEMFRSLALAETTPGPLIMVVQFVAFLGTYRDPGSLDPWVAAFTAALLTSWVTFVPCFLFSSCSERRTSSGCAPTPR